MQATVQPQTARRSLRSIWYRRVRWWSRNGPLVAASARYMATSTANAHVHIRIRRTHAQTERRRTHAQTERRSCRLILPSPMLLWCSLAAPKLASTYNRTHGTMKEEHDERGGGERGAERRVVTLQCESRTPICCCARPLPTTVPTSAIRRCISPGGPPDGPPARA